MMPVRNVRGLQGKANKLIDQAGELQLKYSKTIEGLNAIGLDKSSSHPDCDVASLAKTLRQHILSLALHLESYEQLTSDMLDCQQRIADKIEKEQNSSRCESLRLSKTTLDCTIATIAAEKMSCEQLLSTVKQCREALRTASEQRRLSELASLLSKLNNR